MSNRKNGNGKSTDEKNLAHALAIEYERMLEASLPRIASAVEDEERSASFSATVSFRHTKHGLVATLSPRERIPMEALEFMVRVDNGQLELFSGPHAAGEVQDMEQPGA